MSDSSSRPTHDPAATIDPTKDYYGALELDAHATQADIRDAWKRLSIKLHPDRNPNDPDAEEKFKELSSAHDILSDVKSRQTYDRFRREYASDRRFSWDPETEPETTPDDILSNLANFTLGDFVRASMYVFQGRYGVQIPDEAMDNWQMGVEFVFGTWDQIHEFEARRSDPRHIDLGPFGIDID